MSEQEKNLNLSELKEYATIVNEATRDCGERYERIIEKSHKEKKWLIVVIAIITILWAADHTYLTYQSYKPEDAKIAVEQDFKGQTQHYQNTSGGASVNEPKDNDNLQN